VIIMMKINLPICASIEMAIAHELESRYWDPCCNPNHSWMLEQKMEELGWFYEYGDDIANFFKRGNYHVGKIGVNRLHATTLAADAAVNGTKIEQTQTR